MKKVISLWIVICMVVCLFPLSAMAAYTPAPSERTIQFGTDGINSIKTNYSYYIRDYDYVYLGAKDGSPIRWRVLDTKTNTGEAGIFLLTEDTYKPVSKFGHGGNGRYQGSKLYRTMASFGEENLSRVERDSLIATYKSDEAYPLESKSWDSQAKRMINETAAEENALNGDKLFALSYEEACNKDYFYDSKIPQLKHHYGLRSTACFKTKAGPSSFPIEMVLSSNYLYVSPLSYIHPEHGEPLLPGISISKNKDDQHYLRPAANLDSSSVLFSSSAFAKSSGGINQISSTAQISTWQLTLLDRTRYFHAATVKNSVVPGKELTLFYSGATLGTNEYISVIITDSENTPLYYGRIAQPKDENGFLNMTVPSDLEEGDYTFRFFNECYNSGTNTNYSDIASAFCDVEIKVDRESRVPFSLDLTGKSVYLGNYAGTPLKWNVLAESNGKSLLLAERTFDVARYNLSASSIYYRDSTLRSWLNGYDGSSNLLGISYENDSAIENLFSVSEQMVIANTALENDVSDKIFILSENDIKNLDYFKNSSALLTCDAMGQPASWWLRSTELSSMASCVTPFGVILPTAINQQNIGVRPAINLENKWIAFVTNLNSGSQTTAATSSDEAYTLTLFDSAKAAFKADAGITQDNLLIVNYSNASVGENEYLCILIADANGKITYYDRLLQLDGSTNKADGAYEQPLSVPIPEGSTAYVCNETYGGEKTTNYTGALYEVYHVGGESGEDSPADTSSSSDSSTGDGSFSASNPATGDLSFVPVLAVLWILVCAACVTRLFKKSVM